MRYQRGRTIPSAERLCGGITQHRKTMSNQETAEGDCPPTTCSAFPFDMDYGSVRVTQHGMTLRDFFAAQVAGHVFGQLIATGSHYEPTKVAYDAYAIAEAMMIRRQNVKAES